MHGWGENKVSTEKVIEPFRNPSENPERGWVLLNSSVINLFMCIHGKIIVCS